MLTEFFGMGSMINIHAERCIANLYRRHLPLCDIIANDLHLGIGYSFHKTGTFVFCFFLVPLLMLLHSRVANDLDYVGDVHVQKLGRIYGKYNKENS